MSMLTIAKRLNTNIQEVQSLGLSSMMRHFYKTSYSIMGRGDDFARMRTKFGDLYFRPMDTDNIVMSKIFVEREYDLDKTAQGAQVRAAYDRILAAGKTPLIIDAGGNIGLAARFFAHAYPRAHIVSVEPDARSCSVARKNAEGFDNIEVIEAAIGARPGYVSLQCEKNASWATRTQRSDDGTRVVTIDDIKKRHEDSEILIVKIDIEGFESDLFSTNLGWVDETMAILIEPHDWMMPGVGTSQTMQHAVMRGDRDLLILGENLALVKRDPGADGPPPAVATGMSSRREAVRPA